MATIIPFRAWRYNSNQVGDVLAQFSPLSDVLNSSLLKNLYENPYNSIHVSIPENQKEAVSKMQDWKENRILIQDEYPTIYVLYQYFSLPNEDKVYVRKGFMCLVRLKEGADDDVIIHESTIAASVQDRAELLSKMRMNVVPTHGLYEDNDFFLEEIMDNYIQQPLYEYEDIQNVRNVFANITEAKDIQTFISILETKKIYLADGHHRLESSHFFIQKLKKEGKWSEEGSENYHLMYLSNLCSDDLRILPTHRIWKPTIDAGIEKYINQIDNYFTITDISGSPTPLYEYLRDRPYAFGLLYKDYEYMIELKKEIQPKIHISLPLPIEVKNLAYTVLHYFMFEKIACIPYNRQNISPQIRYEKSYSKAIKEAAKGAYAFICHELTMSEMMAVCNSGAIMPPKATFFYPKVVCGMVFADV